MTKRTTRVVWLIGLVAALVWWFARAREPADDGDERRKRRLLRCIGALDACNARAKSDCGARLLDYEDRLASAELNCRLAREMDRQELDEAENRSADSVAACKRARLADVEQLRLCQAGREADAAAAKQTDSEQLHVCKEGRASDAAAARAVREADAEQLRICSEGRVADAAAARQAREADARQLQECQAARDADAAAGRETHEADARRLVECRAARDGFELDLKTCQRAREAASGASEACRRGREADVADIRRLQSEVDRARERHASLEEAAANAASALESEREGARRDRQDLARLRDGHDALVAQQSTAQRNETKMAAWLNIFGLKHERLAWLNNWRQRVTPVYNRFDAIDIKEADIETLWTAKDWVSTEGMAGILSQDRVVEINASAPQFKALNVRTKVRGNFGQVSIAGCHGLIMDPDDDTVVWVAGGTNKVHRVDGFNQVVTTQVKGVAATDNITSIVPWYDRGFLLGCGSGSIYQVNRELTEATQRMKMFAEVRSMCISPSGRVFCVTGGGVYEIFVETARTTEIADGTRYWGAFATDNYLFTGDDVNLDKYGLLNQEEAHRPLGTSAWFFAPTNAGLVFTVDGGSYRILRV